MVFCIEYQGNTSWKTPKIIFLSLRENNFSQNFPSSPCITFIRLEFKMNERDNLEQNLPTIDANDVSKVDEINWTANTTAGFPQTTIVVQRTTHI
jgi:hypothetical protein